LWGSAGWSGRESTRRSDSFLERASRKRAEQHRRPQHIWCLAGAETSDARRHRAVGNRACIRRERWKYAEQPGMGARHRAQRLAPQRIRAVELAERALKLAGGLSPI